MKVLTIASRKGGVGKTTLTAHLGVLAQESGLRVLLVDADPQGSLSVWADLRDADQPEIHTAAPSEVPELIPRCHEVGFDLVIVDSAPAHSNDISILTRIADYTLIPTRPALFDVMAAGSTVEIVTALNRRGAMVINGAQPPRGVGESSSTVDARNALSSQPLPVAPHSISNRSILGKALVSGSAVTETDPTGKASTELRKLWDWIKQEMGIYG